MQLMRLAPAWRGCDVTYITTDPQIAPVLFEAARSAGEPQPGLEIIVEANRWHKLRLIRQFLQLVLILGRLRPDAVITTGAAPGYFALRLAKLFGARTVWIDSVANAEELSLSGKKVRPYADLWLTQWPHLATPDGPKCLGSVL